MDATDLGGRLPLLPVAGLSGDRRALYDRLVEGRLGRNPPFRSRTDEGDLIGPFNACLYAPVIGGVVSVHRPATFTRVAHFVAGQHRFVA